MKIKRLLLGALASLCLSASAQMLTVTGSQLSDATGALVSNATIAFAPVNNLGQPISFRAGTSGQVIRVPITYTITTPGYFSVTLPDVSKTNPANVCFRVTVTDNETGDVVLGPTGYTCVQPSTASYAAQWCSS